MHKFEAGAWGAAWTGLFALLLGGFVASLKMASDFPFYTYLQLADFLPFWIITVLMALACSRAKLVALGLWVLASAFSVFVGLSQFPNWGLGVTDLGEAQERRFESVSFLSDGLVYFGSLILFVAGLSLLLTDVSARRRNRAAATPAH